MAIEMSKDELEVWDVYLAEIFGWTFHPGYYRENATKPTMDQCANIADEMILKRRDRLTGVGNETENSV